MFNLVLSVISIALVIGLALTSIFYGGSIFTESASKSASAQVVNAFQQIDAALQLFKAENAGGLPADANTDSNLVDDLADGTYLQGAPTPPKVAGSEVYVMDTAANGTSIDLGESGAKVCADIADKGNASVTTVADVAAAVTQLGTDNAKFGCYASTVDADTNGVPDNHFAVYAH